MPYKSHKSYKSYKPYVLLWLLLMLAACSDDEAPAGGGSSPGPTLTLNIGVATGESFLHTRATDVGDPGTTETFRNPRYLYVFLYDEDKEKSYCVYEGPNSEGEPAYVCHDLSDDATTITPIAHSSWTEGTHDYAPLPTEGDRILRSSLGIDLSTIGGDRGKTARIYVAASYWNFNNISKGAGSGEELITKIQFDAPKHTPSYSSVIRDIYSTPYNLADDGTLLDDDKTYYGTIDNFSGQELKKEIILYHVGAKLDLNWNIPEALHSEMWLSDMELSDMRKENAFLFRPMENTNVTLTGSYDEGSLSGEGGPIISIGNQWYGRKVFYVIPWFSSLDDRKFNFKMQLWRNGLTQANYKTQYLADHTGATDDEAANAASHSGYETDDITVDIPDQADQENQENPLAKVFTPWMLGRLTITTLFKHHNE